MSNMPHQDASVTSFIGNSQVPAAGSDPMPDEAPDERPRDFMCVLPWVNMHVATSGAISPCCEFAGETANLSSSTLEAAWQGPVLEKVRRAFLKGTPLAACRKCLDREAGEGSSLRKLANQRFARHLQQIDRGNGGLASAASFPIALDLRFSNLCNFKCRSCWHGASSKWFSDGKAIGLTVGDQAEISSFSSVDSFMEQLQPGLAGLEYIYFAGGEPLLQPEHYALLRKLIELGRTDLALAYNSNMSVTSFRDSSIFELWSHFPKVEVEASVDAAGPLGALVRKGFIWSTFVSNVAALRQRCPRVKVRFGITVSIMNIMALPDLFAALERECAAEASDYFLHSLQDPIFYRTQVLPAPLKRKAENALRSFMRDAVSHDDGEAAGMLCGSIEGIIDYMNAQDLSGQLPRLLKRTRLLDALRYEHSGIMFPWLARYLSEPAVPGNG